MSIYEPVEEWFDGELRTLPNGVVVWAKGSKEAKQYAIRAGVRVGSLEDPLDKPGCAHFFEHMPFRGAGRFECEIAMSSLLEEWSGDRNAYTGRDITVFHTTSHPQTRDHALEMIYSLVAMPHFSGTEIEREAILREYRENRVDLFRRAEEKLYPWLYRNPRWQRPVIGTLAGIQSITTDDLQKFHTTWYRPKNLVVTIVGPEESTALLDHIEHYFGQMTPHSQPVPLLDYSPEVKSGPVSLGWDRPEGYVWFECPFEKSLPSFLLSRHSLTIVAGGTSSPLYQELREKRGLFYSSDGDIGTVRDRGYMRFTAAIDPVRMEDFWKVFPGGVISSCSISQRLQWAHNNFYATLSQASFRPARVAASALDALMDFGSVTLRNEVATAVLNFTVGDVEATLASLLDTNQTVQARFVPDNL